MRSCSFLESAIDDEIADGMRKSADFLDDLAVGGNRVAKSFARAGTELGRLGHGIVAAANNNLNPFGGHMGYHADWADDFDKEIDRYYDTGEYGRRAVALEQESPIFRGLNDFNAGIIAAIPETVLGGWLAKGVGAAGAKASSLGGAVKGTVAATRAGQAVSSAVGAAANAAPRTAKAVNWLARGATAPIRHMSRWLAPIARLSPMGYAKSETVPLVGAEATRLGLKDPSGEADRLAGFYRKWGLDEGLPWSSYPFEEARRTYEETGGWPVYDAGGSQVFRVKADGQKVPVLTDDPYRAAAMVQAAQDANEWFQSKAFGAYGTSPVGKLFANPYAVMNDRPQYELRDDGTATGEMIPVPHLVEDGQIKTKDLYGLGNRKFHGVNVGNVARGAIGGLQWILPGAKQLSVPGMALSDIANGRYGDAYTTMLGAELAGGIPSASSVPFARSNFATRGLYDLATQVPLFMGTGYAASKLPEAVNRDNGVAEGSVSALLQAHDTARVSQELTRMSDDLGGVLRELSPSAYERYSDFLAPNSDPGSKLIGIRGSIAEIRGRCNEAWREAVRSGDRASLERIASTVSYLDYLENDVLSNFDPRVLQDDYMESRGGFDPSWYDENGVLK